MRIFNLNHKIKEPTKIKIGIFTIIINQKHCERVQNIYQPTKHIYKHGSPPEVEEITKKYSKWLETALLETSEISPSLLQPDNPTATNITDFLMILSFISGRRVISETNVKRFNPNKNSSSITNLTHFFYYYGNKLIANIKGLTESKLESAFCNFVSSLDKDEFFEKASYAFSILNSIYEHNFSNYPKVLSGDARKKLQDAAIEAIRSKGEELNIDPKIIEDINKTGFGNFGTPSAVQKIRMLVVDMGILTAKESEEYFDKIRMINQIRNSIAHNGDMRIFQSYEHEKNLRINVYMIEYIFDLIQFYFLFIILKIDEPEIEHGEKSKLRQFFIEGSYNGHHFFEENYLDFLERKEKEWLENQKY
ncbi:hypothetical protein [Leptospira harrisiae]|uniref:hypothetical protein n=1 Tax=Leptospira harrisiae TaxID=2023189 RepID=UPI001A9C8357|nr:hypothetical protein [Leptospira harrisiae]